MSRPIAPQNNRDLNQGLLHLWSKFGDPSLNWSQVIARPSKWLPHTQTHRQTEAGNDITQRPKLASGKNVLSSFDDLYMAPNTGNKYTGGQCPHPVQMEVLVPP